MATLRSGEVPATTLPRGGKTPLRLRLWRDRWMYAFMLPGFFYFILFIYTPLLGNVIAFKDYAPFIGIQNSPWVGLENFSRLLSDQDFRRALVNTVQIEILQLVFAFPAPLALALLLHSLISNNLKRAIQSIVYLPHFLSWIIIIALWQQVFGGAGFINQLLANQDLDRINIMGNPDFFKPLVVLQSIWKDIGWGTIIFLAALTRIDVQLYEAAVIDGANGRRRLLDVTLPGIANIIILLLILRMGSMFSTGFEQYFLQRNAVGPDAAEVIDTFVYYSAFQGGDWSFSTAVGLVRGIVAAIMILGANWIAKRFSGEGLL